MSGYLSRPWWGRVMRAGVSASQRAAARARERGRGVRCVAVTAVAVGIAASGCGDSAGSESEQVSLNVVTATSAQPVHDQTAVSRARRLREFRHMIVALHRVPGADELNRDPLDQLWHGLGKLYGPALDVARTPRSVRERQIPGARRRLRRGGCRARTMGRTMLLGGVIHLRAEAVPTSHVSAR